VHTCRPATSALLAARASIVSVSVSSQRSYAMPRSAHSLSMTRRRVRSLSSSVSRALAVACGAA